METSDVDFWLAPFQQLAADLGAWAPKLLAALVILTVGLALAWIARTFAATVFRALKLDARLEGLWLFRVWTNRLHGHQPTAVAASFFFYSVLFLSALLAIRVMGVTASQDILNALWGVVPRVLSFMLILFLGALLAMLLSVIAQLILAGSDVQHPSFWGKVIAWSTFGLTVVFSLEPLGLAGKLVTTALLILLASLGLTGALAFGVGCKDLAREFLIEIMKEDKHPPR